MPRAPIASNRIVWQRQSLKIVLSVGNLPNSASSNGFLRDFS
ncbi:hypothetical protein CKA32_002454 [Geitlerinema sp. FC II]|nr:hypothetical protein CKA32_002454 [Geitlerinema sp. FC II]